MLNLMVLPTEEDRDSTNALFMISDDSANRALVVVFSKDHAVSIAKEHCDRENFSRAKARILASALVDSSNFVPIYLAGELGAVLYSVVMGGFTVMEERDIRVDAYKHYSSNPSRSVISVFGPTGSNDPQISYPGLIILAKNDKLDFFVDLAYSTEAVFSAMRSRDSEPPIDVVKKVIDICRIPDCSDIPTQNLFGYVAYEIVSLFLTRAAANLIKS